MEISRLHLFRSVPALINCCLWCVLFVIIVFRLVGELTATA